MRFLIVPGVVLTSAVLRGLLGDGSTGWLAWVAIAASGVLVLLFRQTNSAFSSFVGLVGLQAFALFYLVLAEGGSLLAHWPWHLMMPFAAVVAATVFLASAGASRGNIISYRPATALATAASAVFFFPPFGMWPRCVFSPLQALIVFAVAPTLIAIVPVQRWRRQAQTGYVALEPLLAAVSYTHLRRRRCLLRELVPRGD